MLLFMDIQTVLKVSRDRREKGKKPAIFNNQNEEKDAFSVSIIKGTWRVKGGNRNEYRHSIEWEDMRWNEWSSLSKFAKTDNI